MSFCLQLKSILIVITIHFQSILSSVALNSQFYDYIRSDESFGKIKNKLTNETIVVNTCGLSHAKDTPINDKIVGGFEAINGQFPYQVLLRLRRKDNRLMMCGGSILNKNWVLTAAHCISDEYLGDSYVNGVQVIAGITRRDLKGVNVQKRSVDCVLQHEKWIGIKGGFATDIALLRIPALNITHISGGVVNGICLPLKGKTPFEYIGKARISGWGVTENDRSSPVLKFTDVGLIDDKKCQKNNFPFPIVESMLCQGIDRTSPCFGDSGGPLVVKIKGRYTQIGVVSTGPPQCANADDPNGIYTQVSHYLGWIENTISRNSKERCFGFTLKEFE